MSDFTPEYLFSFTLGNFAKEVDNLKLQLFSRFFMIHYNLMMCLAMCGGQF